MSRICCVCNYREVTIKCVQCKRYVICTDCINNLQSRKVHHMTGYLEKVKIYKYEELHYPTITYDCPLCRKENDIKMFESEFSKEDVIRLTYRDYAKLCEHENEIKRLREILRLQETESAKKKTEEEEIMKLKNNLRYEQNKRKSVEDLYYDLLACYNNGLIKYDKESCNQENMKLKFEMSELKSEIEELKKQIAPQVDE